MTISPMASAPSAAVPSATVPRAAAPAIALSQALPTSRFAPVTLDEIVSEAALLTRVDRKYLIPREDAARLLRGLDAGTRVLDIAGQRAFAYDSVYFDTTDHLSYRLTAQRRRRRFKLRTRSYVDTGGTFLELKTKSGRGTTVKQRIAYGAQDRARITPEGGAYAADLLRCYGHDPSLISRMRPSVVSRYRRATLLMPDGSRATFDTDLRWEAPDGHALALTLDDYAIVESKSAGRPSSLDRALWRAGHRPTGISKFGTGTAALYPQLPHNKWARVLAGPFAAAQRSPIRPMSDALSPSSLISHPLTPTPTSTLLTPHSILSVTEAS